MKFSTGVGEGGKWIGFVNTGWYYHAYLEQYNYVLHGTQSATGVAGTLNTATANISYRPAWGPVLITGSGSAQYTIHNNGYQPAKTQTWISAGNGYYYVAIPSSAIVVGMRDLTILPLGQVSASGYLISDKLFWVDRRDTDPSLHRVWIKPKTTNPDNYYFIDYLYPFPTLKMREVVVQEPAGVLPSYQGIDSLVVSRGNQTQTLSSYVSGYATHSLSGVSVGDWITLEYWIRKSYVLQDHQTIKFYTTATSGDVVTIHYETSVPDLIPPIAISAPRTEILNFNPLYSDAYRAGYLFHATPSQQVSAYWRIGSVSVNLEKEVVCAEWREHVKGTALVLDKQGLPVPWYPITMSFSALATSVARYPSSTVGTTDGRGEVHFIMQPATGTTWFFATATAGTYSSTATCWVRTQRLKIPRATFFAGHVNLFVSREFTPRRFYRTYMNHVMLDGIPRKSASITLKSKLASIFEYNKTLSNNYITVPTKVGPGNSNAIAGLDSKLQVGYLPQPNDRLVAYTTVPAAQSKILEVDLD